MAIYTPTLDKVLKDIPWQEPCVPYRKPDSHGDVVVGGRYWSYSKDAMMQVLEISESGKVKVLFVATGNEEWVNTNKVGFDLELLPVEFRIKEDFYPVSNAEDVATKLQNYARDALLESNPDHVSLSGAEIKFLCAFGVFDPDIRASLNRKYFTNRAKYKTSDYAYYYLRRTEKDGFRYWDLIRDTNKSPRYFKGGDAK